MASSCARPLTAAEVIDALEECHRALASGQPVNSPPYRVFTPRSAAEYGPQFPEGGEPTHHSFTSLTGAIATLDVTSDRVDSVPPAKRCKAPISLAWA